MEKTYHVVRASYGKATSHISTYLEGPFVTKEDAQDFLFRIYSSLVNEFAGKIVSCSYDFYLDSFTIETNYCIHQAEIF